MAGGGGFGRVPWGSSWGATSAPSGLDELVSVSDSLTVFIPFKLNEAEAVSPLLVRVLFNHALDPGYAPNFDPASYSIPGLTVLAVHVAAANAVTLTTTPEQDPIVYTLTVLDAKSLDGESLAINTADFAGFLIQPHFFATAQSSSKVQLTFSTAMLQNAAYIDAASYAVTDLNGTSIPILSATAVGPSPNRRVALEVAVPLVAGGYYVATVVSLNVKTTFGVLIEPDTSLFQWTAPPNVAGQLRIDLKISSFSGEVTGGILGDPAGLVYFSPSLDAVAPTSAIQVDEVSTCTRAYDVYTPPSPPDPTPLYTFSPFGPAGGLGLAVLFTTFDRLFGAHFEFGLNLSDSMGSYSTGPAVAILAQPFDPAYVSLLNNSFWTTFDGITANPFITANNLAPIPPGPTQVILLEGVPEAIAEDSYGGDPWGGMNWG